MFNKKAEAVIKGGNKYTKIEGVMKFEQIKEGVMITVIIHNLPTTKQKCENRIFGLHIHEGTSCTGTLEDEFANVKMHYNPQGCNHPYHAGDLPPLFENNGYAYMKFLTNRFTVKDIIGRVVVIHSQQDDFTTQPSGNSGEKIACGKIK